MKKIVCCLLTGFLFLAPTLTAYGISPRIITVNGGTQLSSTFNGTQWVTNDCPIETQINSIPAWGGTSYIRLGDFNGNGTLDIASPNGGWLMIKTADPNPPINYSPNCLWSLPPYEVDNLWGGANYTWVGDFNGDRKDDIASASGSVVYMKLSNPGSFEFTGFDSQTWYPHVVGPVIFPDPLWGGSDYTFVGDFNGDNKDDIASAVGSSVRVLISTGSSFEIQTWNITNEWAVPGWNRVGDFNGDNKDDIASAKGATVHMKLSAGDGFISQYWGVTSLWGSAAYTWVIDVNRDGRSDFISADAGNLRVKLSQGGSFASHNWPVSSDWGGPQYTWIMDYDSDGDKDIVSGFNSWTLVTKKNNYVTNSFSSHSFNYFGWWGAPELTFALDYSRFGLQ
jgi:hypothetical protein